MVGRLLSYWGGLFSGAMLVSGRVLPSCFVSGRILQIFLNLCIKTTLSFIWGSKSYFFHFCKSFVTKISKDSFLYFYPSLGRWSNLSSIFFKWVETQPPTTRWFKVTQLDPRSLEVTFSPLKGSLNYPQKGHQQNCQVVKHPWSL